MQHFKLIAGVVLAMALLPHCGEDAPWSGGGQSSPSYDACVVTGLPPTISTITPTTASISAATVVTISGYGYCFNFPSDVITIGTSATVATSYALVAAPTASDIESLTFTLPAGTPLGSQSVYVTVMGNTSNSTTLTVTP